MEGGQNTKRIFFSAQKRRLSPLRKQAAQQILHLLLQTPQRLKP
jgi:hypothetical protein